jgi:hypothetical protein
MAHVKWRVATISSNHHRVVLHLGVVLGEYVRSMSMAYGVESQWIISKHL